MAFEKLFREATFLILIQVLPLVTSLCVDALRGEDTDTCFGNERCCKSLKFLFDRVPMDTHIYIQLFSDLPLNGTLEIKNIENVEIQGNDSLVHCNQHVKNTGIYMENVTGMALYNLTIAKCSMLQNSSTIEIQSNLEYKMVLCAVYIINCTNLTMQNVNINNNNGTGMLIYDTDGAVSIVDSTFENNTISGNALWHPGGGGLKIEFTPCNFHSRQTCHHTSMNPTKYIIKNSYFISNFAFESSPTYSYGSYQGQGRGGGLFIALRGKTSTTEMRIQNCMFLRNRASTSAGGMSLLIQDNAANNKIIVKHCNFVGTIVHKLVVE